MMDQMRMRGRASRILQKAGGMWLRAHSFDARSVLVKQEKPGKVALSAGEDRQVVVDGKESGWGCLTARWSGLGRK